MRLISAGGAPIAVQTGSPASRVDLMPRQQIEMILECRSQEKSVDTTLILSLAGGGSMTISAKLPPGCPGASVSAFQQGPAPIPQSGVASLTVLANLPNSGSRGQMLTYTITLRNVSAQAVQLEPCPSYTQVLSQPQPDGVSVLKVQNTYLLNCAVHAVPALGDVTFQMRMRVPDDWQPLPTKFLWRLEIEGLPAAGAALQIT
jgi:hypothetical protein